MIQGDDEIGVRRAETVLVEAALQVCRPAHVENAAKIMYQVNALLIRDELALDSSKEHGAIDIDFAGLRQESLSAVAWRAPGLVEGGRGQHNASLRVR